MSSGAALYQMELWCNGGLKMNKITCPKCGTSIDIDDASYAQIVSQVHNAEFEKALQERLAVAEDKQKLIVQNALLEQRRELEEEHARQVEELKTDLHDLEEQLEKAKNYKLQLSTKMIGESLEQHCLAEFNAIRATAFPNAYFEKDNDAHGGSKGDFIFREKSDGVEFISIMFEMKNEADQTASKHKNESFFEKLHKDRCEKGCEYAVLVSMLESDSELYNRGIVDVSYRYEKMYVIRPQYFIPLIGLLRNAAMSSLQYRRELQLLRDQQIDITNFEDNIQSFKDNIGQSYHNAVTQFEKAIESIDKSIDNLYAVKEALLMSQKHLGTVNSKASKLTIRKLTRNAPSVKRMFDELEKDAKTDAEPEIVIPDSIA